jgi:3'(2'), 5'-bisphosphate nucleotidase
VLIELKKILHIATIMLSSNQISSLIVLAKSAGDGVMRIYDETLSVDRGEGSVVAFTDKEDGSPVTAADLLSHRIIVDGLARLTPDIPVVSEEDADSIIHRTPNGRFWLIDPLDGTREFISRNGEFTINIALIEKGLPVFGIVLAPCINLLYWGGIEFGAFREQDGKVEKIILPDREHVSHQPMRVVASRSHMNRETNDFIERLGICDVVQAGSSLKFCRIAEGSADIYPRFGTTSEWDTAAGQAIVEAMGGYVYALDGKSLRYGKRDILNPHFIAAFVPLANLRQS